MKRFVWRTLLFSLPVFAVLGALEYMFYSRGELKPMSEVVAYQLKAQGDTYYSRKYFNELEVQYKLRNMAERQPDILVVGQSTVLAFSAPMFHPFEASMYNIGRIIKTGDNLLAVLDDMAEGRIKRPKALLVGIDNTLFKDISPQMAMMISETYTEHTREEEIFSSKAHLRAMQAYTKELLEFKKSYPALRHAEGFGFGGYYGIGFRADGSRQDMHIVQAFLKKPMHQDRRLLIPDMLDGVGRFAAPYTIDQDLKDKVLAALQRLASMGTEVVVYFPPYSDNIYDKIGNAPDSVQMLFADHFAFEQRIADAGLPVIRFQTPSKLGLSDLYMRDSNHPSETLTAIQWLAFLKTQGRSLPYLSQIDTLHLQSLLEDPLANPQSLMLDAELRQGQ